MAQAVGKAWTLSPTFRAEKSDTPRHLSEFYMLEAEFCFVQDLSGVMDLVETLLRSVTRELQQSTTGQELLLAQKSKTGGNEDSALTPESLEQRWSKLVQSPWPRISYVEAINILQDAAQPKSANFTFQPTYESGLQAEHEKYLAQHVGEGGPVFVTDYPAVQKPFYMSQSGSISEKDASPTVACFDLLVPDICEIVGGSMREDDLERLLKAMQRQGMKLGKEYQQILEPGNTEAYETAPEVGSLDWYADLRRFGSVPHGGFGLGFDRLLCYLAGVSSIRDMVVWEV
ncbi:MAG: asparaginyl-tRNA synthetase [Bogoriella megaspora]|nr:MAG: asparaginyl-tRNA synthetase [Bogoriella megaspora]